jgi:hypothetical protein
MNLKQISLLLLTIAFATPSIAFTKQKNQSMRQILQNEIAQLKVNTARSLMHEKDSNCIKNIEYQTFLKEDMLNQMYHYCSPIEHQNDPTELLQFYDKIRSSIHDRETKAKYKNHRSEVFKVPHEKLDQLKKEAFAEMNTIINDIISPLIQQKIEQAMPEYQ